MSKDSNNDKIDSTQQNDEKKHNNSKNGTKKVTISINKKFSPKKVNMKLNMKESYSKINKINEILHEENKDSNKYILKWLMGLKIIN